MGFKRMAREALLAAGLLSASGEAEAGGLTLNISAEQQEAAERARWETVSLTSENWQDAISRTIDHNGSIVFANEDGNPVNIKDGQGNELYPTSDRDTFQINIDGTQHVVEAFVDTPDGPVACPEGYRVVENESGDVRVEPNVYVNLETEPTVTPLPANYLETYTPVLFEGNAYVIDEAGQRHELTDEFGTILQVRPTTQTIEIENEDGETEEITIPAVEPYIELNNTEFTEFRVVSSNDGQYTFAPPGYVVERRTGQDRLMRMTTEEAEENNNIVESFEPDRTVARNE